MTIRRGFRLLFVVLMCFPALLSANTYQRIVSLDICSDWMLTRYADPSRVIALSPLLHDYPVETGQFDWPTHDGSLEQILELEPDLVITGEFNAIILRKRLMELAVHVEVLSLPQSLIELREYMQQFMNLLDADAELPSLLNPDTPAADAPRLLLLGANGVGTGIGTLEHEILEQAGWRNYITYSGYGNLDLEQLVLDPPDAILWSAPASRALANMFYEHPALKQVMLNKPSVSIGDGRWQCAGPWTWQQIQQLKTMREQWQTK